MSKRKAKKTKNNLSSSKVLGIIAWILSFITVALIALSIGYYYGYSHAKRDISKKEKQKERERLAILKKLETVTTADDKKSVNERLKEVLQKKDKYTKEPIEEGAAHEYEESSLAKPPVRIQRDLKVLGDKPKLAIILDDVSVRSQVEAIKSLNLPLTMSFLPPSKARPNSAKLAALEPFYMVHLPMEAMKFNKEEPFTLRVEDSQQKINNIVENVKKIFPRVSYINNHTGSKFTDSEIAVNRLIYSLNKHDINFIDSRTIGSTKVPKVMNSFGLKYVSRDVFLDHHTEKSYIKKQIKQAITVAKKHGSAIAIGHPHSNTLMAIDESRSLFSDVELVFVDRLY